MFIDTHCHLNFRDLENDLPEVLERAKKANVGKIVIPGAKLDSSKKAVEIANKNNNCFAAVGIHPHHTDEFSTLGKKQIREELVRLTENKKVVAIGEIGMDYHHYKNSPPPTEETKKIQKELFLLQLDIAYQKKLPVIIHCRWAQTDVFNIILQFLKEKPLTGVFHCFDGNEKYLKNVINLGFYIGFDGNSTYEENKHLQKLISLTPLDRLLLETDAPFLAPLPFRGQRNEPSYLIETAKKMGEIHKRTLKEVEEITCSNAINLFSI